jgi:hypothetical protein
MKNKSIKMIELTLNIDEKPKIYINPKKIMELFRLKKDSYTQISFSNDYYIYVTETPQEILEIINK